MTDENKIVIITPSKSIDLAEALFDVKWVHKTPKFKNPMNTVQNWQVMFDAYNVTSRYNIMTKEPEINIPNRSHSPESALENSTVELISCAIMNKLSPTHAMAYIGLIADKHRYHPVVDWINSKEWDRVDRIKPLTDTLDAVNPSLAQMLLRRWLIAAVQAVFGINGVKAQGVLILQGGQGIGKTTWIENLADDNYSFIETEGNINPDNKDKVKECISKWIVELSELDGTLKKSDIAALKAFITRPFDELRLPYAKTAKKYIRRTVFAGSVNNPLFLDDPTGNRRFWTIACKKGLNCFHDVSMQQVYAQVKTYYDKGERGSLTKEEEIILRESNEENHESIHPIEEHIREHWDFSKQKEGEQMIKTEALQATEILKIINYTNISNYTAKVCSGILRNKLKLIPRKAKDKTVYDMPIKQDLNKDILG